mmetsp:Transcript_22319/g.10709  ORF Transcript_22319/g.10709 Transcript_22319/m.10709 type:complete len:170 (-) Transcript_22319:5241-5750(-)
MCILRIRFNMTLNHINLFNNNPPCFQVYFQNFSDFAFVFASHNFDLVIFSYMAFILQHSRYLSKSHYKTSGASEIIFINFFARNSLATGPKIRVPTGSLLLVINTAELSSNLIYEPSGLLTAFFVRTTTAFVTSPFFTLALGIASFTETTIISPTLAYLLLEPPSTLIQ